MRTNKQVPRVEQHAERLTSRKKSQRHAEQHAERLTSQKKSRRHAEQRAEHLISKKKKGAGRLVDFSFLRTDWEGDG